MPACDSVFEFGDCGVGSTARGQARLEQLEFKPEQCSGRAIRKAHDVSIDQIASRFDNFYNDSLLTALWVRRDQCDDLVPNFETRRFRKGRLRHSITIEKTSFLLRCCLFESRWPLSLCLVLDSAKVATILNP